VRKSVTKGADGSIAFLEIQREQSICAEEKSRGVAASAAQSRRDRNPLREPHADSLRGVSRREHFPRALENVGTFASHAEPSGLEVESARGGREEKLVLQTDGLHHGVDFVVAVGPLAQDPEPEVDLGGAADAQRHRIQPAGQ